MRNFILFITITLSSQLLAASAFEEALRAYQAGDSNTAFQAFRTAAEAGDERAFGRLAGLYLYGQGTKKDYRQAYLWFGVSAASGDQYAEGFQRAASSMLEPEDVGELQPLIDEKITQLGMSDKTSKPSGDVGRP